MPIISQAKSFTVGHRESSVIRIDPVAEKPKAQKPKPFKKGEQFVLNVPSGLETISVKQQLVARTAFDEPPHSYTSNSTKEETILEYVEDFRRQFVQVFPNRRPLILCPKNEYDVSKFVCSTVRPSLLPYNELYDLPACATFVAEFLEYLPLDSPCELPTMLPSPMATVQMRRGDCLDFANFLCSLLRGCGHDAYVVSGYAPEWITMAKQTNVEYPEFSDIMNMTEYVLKEEEVDLLADINDPEKEKYTLIKHARHKSKYIAFLEASRKQDAERARLAENSRHDQKIEVKKDPLDGNRVHCWVLVKKGRREVRETLFVEPTTGTVYDARESPYLGIESVWNEHNYWANVQVCPISELNFDLSFNAAWEYVLIEEKNKNRGGGGYEDASDLILLPEDIPDDRDVLDAAMSWTSKIIIDRDLFRSRYPQGYRTAKYKRCLVEQFSEYYHAEEGLILRRTLYSTEKCQKAMEIRETYTHRPDKLMERTIYPLAGKTTEKYGPGRTAANSNNANIMDGLMEFTCVEDKERCFKFYPKSRVDGLVMREETLGLKITEHFQNRDDRLIYRSLALDLQPDEVRLLATAISMAGSGDGDDYVAEAAKQISVRNNQKRSKGTPSTVWGLESLPLRKITEKFARDPSKDAERDVRKRTHFIVDNTIRLDYHFGPGHILSSVHLVDKSETPNGDDTKDYSYRVDPMFPKSTSAGERREHLLELNATQNQLIASIRSHEATMNEWMREFQTEKLKIERHEMNLVKDIYDIAREQSAFDQEKEEDADKRQGKDEYDFLAPFLSNPPSSKTGNHRKKWATQIKDDCLAALKTRLLDRARIIQDHLTKENESLHQAQNHFKRAQGSQGSLEGDDNFIEFAQRARFKIQILEERLTRHEKTAVEKYLNLDKALRNHPKLKEALAGLDD